MKAVAVLVGFMLLASTSHAQLYETDPVLSRPAPEIAPGDPNFHPLSCGDTDVLTIVKKHVGTQDIDTMSVREMGRTNQHALCAVNRGAMAQEGYAIESNDGSIIVYILTHSVAGQIVVDFSPAVMSLALGINRRVP